jgi:hybrid cluster-associated redox disulfide protein
MISPEDTVLDIMRNWPATVQVFIHHKMDCVGCSMAAFESLSDALVIYNLPEEAFVSELESVIQKQE